MDRIIQFKQPLAEIKSNNTTSTTITNLPNLTIAQVSINKNIQSNHNTLERKTSIIKMLSYIFK